MNRIDKTANIIASSGTVFLFLIFMLFCALFNFSNERETYKTISIKLQGAAPSQRTETAQSAVPPENTQQFQASPPADAAPSAPQEISQSSKTVPVQTRTESAKPAESGRTQPSSSVTERFTPQRKEPVLQKSVEELMAEQFAARPSSKSSEEFDWSVFDSEDFSENSSISASASESENSTRGSVSPSVSESSSALEGIAATASEEDSNSGAVSSSNSSLQNNSLNETPSGETKSALSNIKNTTYSSRAQNGIDSTVNVQTAVSSDGRTTLSMADGSMRKLLEPAVPNITLSERAASTIDGSIPPFRITFTVNSDGTVPLNSINIPSSLVSLTVREEIARQIASWRFEDTGSSDRATFLYNIEKY